MGRAVLSYKSVGAVSKMSKSWPHMCFHWQSTSVDCLPGDPGRARNSIGFRTASDHYHREDSGGGLSLSAGRWIADLKSLTDPLPGGSPTLCFSFLLCCSAFPKPVSHILFFAVCADTGWPHRGCVVFPDEGQHCHQWLHGPDTQSVECRHRRMRAHSVWAHVHSALHALTWEQVWA